MTSMLHRFDDHDRLQQRLQAAQLRAIAQSRALQTGLAERYVGLPLVEARSKGRAHRPLRAPATEQAPGAARQA
jgi:hypothetical protein